MSLEALCWYIAKYPSSKNMVQEMSSDWIKNICRNCGLQILIHKDWKSPDPVCGPCRLRLGRFVDAIELLLLPTQNYFSVPDGLRSNLQGQIEQANIKYNEKLKNGLEKGLAWNVAAEQLSQRIWDDKELRKIVLQAIKELRRIEKEDEKAKRRNEQRSARTSDGTRRWTG
jgi:hypothetical protein